MKTEMIRLTDAHTGDCCIRILHKSGLEIRVMEMPAFSTAYAQFGTKYGSVHTRFRQPGSPEITETPAGIAHFLEHKLFETEEGSISDIFGRLGASDNAFTSFDRTVYLFHTQVSFGKALETLLDFVLHPCFTEEGVERERSIIAMEIEEYLDLPSDRLFFQLMEGLFQQHPVRHDVAGTLESIQAITPALLRQCWETFYNLRHMVLCCAGNITAQEVCAIADRLLPDEPPLPAAEKLLPTEPLLPARKYVCRKMAVGKTQFSIGFKSRPVSGIQRLRDSLLASIVIDLLIGSASPLYQRLLAEGLLGDACAADCFAGDGWFCVMAEGESDAPQKVLDALRHEIDRAMTEGLDEAHFEILVRAAYGDTVIGMNAPEAACSAMLDAFMWDVESPFAKSRLLAELTVQDAQQCLAERFLADTVCLSVIEPDEDNTTERMF